MAPPLAAFTQFTARLGRSLVGEEVTRAEALIEDASAIARGHVGLTWFDVDDDDVEVLTAPDGVAAIVLAAALRVFRNPGGYVSESTGDWSGSRAAGATGVEFTEPEVRMLRVLAGQSNVISVPVERDDIVGGAAVAEWAHDQFDGDPIPWVAAEDALVTE